MLLAFQNPATSNAAEGRRVRHWTIIVQILTLCLAPLLLLAAPRAPATLAAVPATDPGWRVINGPLTPRTAHTATLLPDGSVLVAGGSNGQYLTSAERYDPARSVWRTAGTMAEARTYHTATLLPNGRVLVAGGRGPHDLASTELYDPASGTWSATGGMTNTRA
jgi:hypothetical protein